MTSSHLLLKCATRGAKHAMYVVNQIKDSLRRDEELRAKGEATSFTECVRLNRITSLAQDRLAIRLKRFKMGKSTRTGQSEAMSSDSDQDAGDSSIKQEPEDQEDDEDDDGNVLVSLNKTSAALIPQNPKWVPESDFENSDESDEQYDEQDEASVEQKPTPKKEEKKVKSGRKVKASRDAMSTDSEEEETVVMAAVD